MSGDAASVAGHDAVSVSSDFGVAMGASTGVHSPEESGRNNLQYAIPPTIFSPISPHAASTVAAASSTFIEREHALGTAAIPEPASARREIDPGLTAKVESIPSDTVAASGGKAREASNIAFHAFDAALRVLKEVSSPFPPLQLAVGGLIGCIDIFKASGEIEFLYKY
jgi:hypothetical protein